MLQSTKFYEVAKRESSIGVSESPAKELRIQHHAVLQIDVAQGAAVTVFMSPRSVGVVEHQANVLPHDRAPGEFLSFLAVTFDRLLRMDRLGCIYANESNPVVGAENQRVPIDDARDSPDRRLRLAAFRGMSERTGASQIDRVEELPGE